MNNIMPHLDTSIQDIYRKALDADKQIVDLKKQGMAKFSSIFPEQSLFNCTDNTFIPYVSELTNDIAQFKQVPQDEVKLAMILKKMEQLLKILGALKNITKSS
jgi:primosomal protein N''